MGKGYEFNVASRRGRTVREQLNQVSRGIKNVRQSLHQSSCVAEAVGEMLWLFPCLTRSGCESFIPSRIRRSAAGEQSQQPSASPRKGAQLLTPLRTEPGSNEQALTLLQTEPGSTEQTPTSHVPSPGLPSKRLPPSVAALVDQTRGSTSRQPASGLAHGRLVLFYCASSCITLSSGPTRVVF